MAWMMDTLSMTTGAFLGGVVTGKPLSIGGTRLHAGATASGVVVCVRRVFQQLELSLTGKRVVLQGFGKVGGPLGFLLASAGMRVIAVDDVGGAVVNEGGLDTAALSDHASKTGTVAGFPGGDAIDADSIWALPCDLFVPAALGDVITDEVAEKLAAPIVVEAANGPTTTVAEPILDRRGVVVVPDILANAGGVTASYFEWVQSREGYPWDDALVADRLRTRMENSFTSVWTKSEQLGCSLRRAAFALAVERVAAAFEARGLFP
jgi:glutamate dehydrogenase (NAD(P)+)